MPSYKNFLRWNRATKSGEQYILSSTTVLSNDAIKELPTTPLTIVPAQGDGTVIFPLSTIISIDTGNNSYTNIAVAASIEIRYEDGGSSSAVAQLLNGNGFEGVSNLLTGFTKITVSLGDYSRASAMVGGVPGVYLIQPDSVDLYELTNKSLQLVAENGAEGNWTGGDDLNSGFVTALYTVIQLP